ncbi:AcrR family transcriptional regulator [Streptosporangium album]|uniref:AcrR family transcriptional regulator n=1 Tax=Streptosporangium album TaxID=47479 RepID=A0A7W7RT36_9ACTN|nr:TetR/AcrR family transcriptional regulator [Streptosporangium album]MBB4937729.1 AcrR family transcriptional regulator [Streptosporangium album]
MARTGATRRNNEASGTKEKARDMRASVALLWGEQEQPTRGPKPSLSSRRIAETAVTLADVEGLEAASMNKVAAEFGVSAMALYRYVPGKAELVELMVEAVLAERPDLSAAGPGWRPQLTGWAHRLWAVYQAHPWLLAATAMRRQVMGPNQLAWLDAALAALEPTGLMVAQRHQIFLLIVGQVRNLAQQLVDFDADHDREWGRLTGELLDRHADRFPALTKAIAEGMFAPVAIDPLDFGLARIFDGVQVLIDHTGGVSS